MGIGFSVTLLREGFVDIAAAQAGLNMDDGQLQHSGGEGTGESCRRVSLHYDNMWLCFFQSSGDSRNASTQQVRQALFPVHYVKRIADAYTELR